MDSKELMARALPEVWKLKEPILSLPESSKPSESEEEKKTRIAGLISDIPSVMREYGFPPRFIRVPFQSPPVVRDREISSLCLTGKAGVGKTMAMAMMVRDWLKERAENSLGKFWGKTTRGSWKFIVFPEFIMEVQDAFKNERSEETPLEMIKRISSVPYLIIDDLGAEKPTEYVRQATYQIINHREMYLLPTFITTNFSMDHLDENIDPRISSRIAGMCEIIRMEGKDRRLEKE